MSKRLAIGLCAASFLAGGASLLLVAYFFGPGSEGGKFELYTGHSRHSRARLGQTWTTDLPDGPHVDWARKNRLPGKMTGRYVPGGSSSWGWFSRRTFRDTYWMDVPGAIHRSLLPEDEKIRLLRQYHAELDVAAVSGNALHDLMMRWRRGPEAMAKQGSMRSEETKP